MAKEEFTIRITKKGEIIVETENMPARRVKDLIKYLEETIGPARQLESVDGDADGRVEVDDLIGRELEEEEHVEERDRQRLRDEQF